MINLLVGILIVALVWILTGALALPYVISVVVTLLVALYLFAPGVLKGHRSAGRSR